MKAEAKNYKGIQYVHLSELPQPQQERIIHTINHNLFIKIMIDGKVVSRCIQYKDYVNWFEDVFRDKVVATQEISLAEPVKMKPDLALNKV